MKSSIPAILLCLVFVAACLHDNRADSPRPPGWIYEGWACAPDAQQTVAGRSAADYCPDRGKREHIYIMVYPLSENRKPDLSICKETAQSKLADPGFVQAYWMPYWYDAFSGAAGPPGYDPATDRRFEAAFGPGQLVDCYLAKSDRYFSEVKAGDGYTGPTNCRCAIAARLRGGEETLVKIMELHDDR